MLAAPAGYEWKEVDLLYISDTLDSLSSYYYTTELYIEGLSQTVTSNEKPDNWTYTGDEHPNRGAEEVRDKVTAWAAEYIGSRKDDYVKFFTEKLRKEFS